MPSTSTCGPTLRGSTRTRCHFSSCRWYQIVFFELIVTSFAISSSERSVNLTGPAHLYEGGSFRLDCKPVEFKLRPTDTTQWFVKQGSTLNAIAISSGDDYSIYGANDEFLSGSAKLQGFYFCVQNGVKSNIFNVAITVVESPLIRNLHNRIVYLDQSAEITFVIQFSGAITIYTTRLSDNFDLDEVDEDINESRNVTISLGNATYTDDSCYLIMVASASGTSTSDTVCVTVKGPPLSPINVMTKTLGPHRIQVAWSLPKSAADSRHEKITGFKVWVESGDWNESWEEEIGVMSSIVRGLQSCSAVKTEVAAKGDKFISKTIVAPIAWTSLQVLNVSDFRLYRRDNHLTFNFSGQERRLHFQIRPINETDRIRICRILLRRADNVEESESSQLSGSCWEADFNYSSTSQTLADIFTDCPTLVDCHKSSELDVVNVCIDVYESLYPTGNGIISGNDIEDQGLSTAVIAVIAVAVAVIVILLACVIIYYRCKNLCLADSEAVANPPVLDGASQNYHTNAGQPSNGTVQPPDEAVQSPSDVTESSARQSQEDIRQSPSRYMEISTTHSGEREAFVEHLASAVARTVEPVMEKKMNDLRQNLERGNQETQDMIRDGTQKIEAMQQERSAAQLQLTAMVTDMSVGNVDAAIDCGEQRPDLRLFESSL